MDKSNTDKACLLIKDAMKELDFPILGAPRKIEEGYEIIFDLENKKRIAKNTIKEQLTGKNLQVLNVDVFIDKCGHYAYALVNPKP